MRPFLALLFLGIVSVSAAEAPIRALLVCGGCCHDYAKQSVILRDGIQARANVQVDVIRSEDAGTKPWFPMYENKDWAKGYDVVIHNECFADTTNHHYIRQITSAHKAGVPAVVIHCAMHTYRGTDIDDWREFLGVTSRRHDHQSRYAVKKVMPDHPIVKGIPDDWKTPMDELYVIDKLWPNAKALATSVSEKDGKTYPVAWINQYGQARVFGTTYGHSDDTFRDPVFLEYVSRGVLWAAGKKAP